MATPLAIDQINQVLAVTDALGLHREHVRIPLGADGDGDIRIAGNMLHITVPESQPFDTWVGGLSDELQARDLSAIPRADD